MSVPARKFREDKLAYPIVNLIGTLKGAQKENWTFSVQFSFLLCIAALSPVTFPSSYDM